MAGRAYGQQLRKGSEKLRKDWVEIRVFRRKLCRQLLRNGVVSRFIWRFPSQGELSWVEVFPLSASFEV